MDSIVFVSNIPLLNEQITGIEISFMVLRVVWSKLPVMINQALQYYVAGHFPHAIQIIAARLSDRFVAAAYCYCLKDKNLLLRFTRENGVRAIN